MPSIRPDFAISGFPWLELTGNIRPRLVIVGATSPGNSLAYTLIDTRTGDTVASDDIPHPGSEEAIGAVIWTGDITPSTPLEIGVLYRETWVGDVNGTDVNVARDAYASAYPMRVPPVSTVLLTAVFSTLANAPSPFGWEHTIDYAHWQICDRIVRSRRADVLTPTRIVLVEIELTIALCLDSLRVFPAEAALYRERAERMLEAMTLDVDVNGDGQADDVSRVAAGGGAGSPAPRR